MSLKRKVDLTPIWNESPLRKKFIKKEYVSKKIYNPFRSYKRVVWIFTELVAHRLIGVEKRAFKQYDIDHKISIYYGFKNNIAPWCIADISNLRILDNKSNLLKSVNNYVDNTNLWILE